VKPEMIHHRHKLTPYSGMELFGEVEETYVGGECAYSQGKFMSTRVGKLIV